LDSSPPVSPTSRPERRRNLSEVSLLDLPLPSGIILPPPLGSEKIKNDLTENLDVRSNVVSLPGTDIDDIVAISDIPIMNVQLVNIPSIENVCMTKNTNNDTAESITEAQINFVRDTKKPAGSAYVHIYVSLAVNRQPVKMFVCVDTGADFTICDDSFLKSHFGKNVVEHITPMKVEPRLKSASGHILKILGQIRLNLYLGQCEMKIPVIVHEGKSNVFLLGSDSFYDKLIFDRGKFLAFANDKYPPIPIHYQLSTKLVKAVLTSRVAPKSSALVSVRVTNDAQLIGQEIVLTPLSKLPSNPKVTRSTTDCSHNPEDNINDECDYDNPIQHTVSKIDTQGNAFILINNTSEDILTIPSDVEIAQVRLLSEGSDERNMYDVDNDVINDFEGSIYSISKASQQNDNLVKNHKVENKVVSKANVDKTKVDKVIVSRKGQFGKIIAKDEIIVDNKNISCKNVTKDIVDKQIKNVVEDQWPLSALKNELHNKLPSNVIVQWDKIEKQQRRLSEKVPCQNINYIHDKEERKRLLDGTGEGLPVPPSADSIHPDEDLDKDPDAWLKNVDHEHLTDAQWLKLKTVLLRNKAAFATTPTEMGCCTYFKVDLPLKPGTGVLRNKPRPLAYKHREMADETISGLLAQGIIRISNSPHATNIVCVKKKTIAGIVSYRICVDLRQVNENSITSQFPNNCIEDAMGKIQRARFRTAVDFKNAFHQLVLTDESISRTAFFYNNVLYEYVRLPFGHVCAMNAYCCLMALLCVGYEPAAYYADDLMITTKVDHEKSDDQLYDQHLIDIEGMLLRIQHAGLKLVAHKCHWSYGSERPMDWLGFTMESNLLRPQESKIKAIKEFPTPTCCKQVLAFIATASFYRRFYPGFAKIAQPLHDVAYAESFVWTEAAQKAFEELKDTMCSALSLRMPRQGELFQMYSDASAGAIGVVLCQIDPADKKSHPCAYGSRKFSKDELKMSIPCKELLAILYGLSLWSFYIAGNPVHVFTDCRAWTFLKIQSGAASKVSRAALLIAEYDISISYVKGTSNKAADGLSRAHDDGLTKYDDQVTPRHPALNLLDAPELPEGEVMKLSDYMVKCEEHLARRWPEIMNEYEAQQIKEGKLVDLAELRSKVPPQIINDTEKDAIDEGQYINQIIGESAILHIDRSNLSGQTRSGHQKPYPFEFDDKYIDEGFDSLETSDQDSEDESINSEESGFYSSDTETIETTDSSFKVAQHYVRLIALNESCFSLEAFKDMQSKDEFCSDKIKLIKQKDQRTKGSGYFMKRNILMRQMHTGPQQYNVLCIPRTLVEPLLKATHGSLMSGHFGSTRYILNMSRKYYWPLMREDMLNFHKTCLPCLYNDKFPIKYEAGFVIKPSWPMHIVHCDLVVGLPKALDGSFAILLLYDGFSRLTFGIPLASEKADYVVKKLMSHFVAAYGLPWALHSDNGRNVDGALIRHLALMLGVVKASTPPHTPRSNPTETMCGAVSMLLRKALSKSDRRYWPLCLPFVLNALNSTVHTATGYTPNSLFFGRIVERDPVPLIPFDAESANVNEYYQKMRRFQELAFQIVRSRNSRQVLAKQQHWNEHAKHPPYQVGDFVLVKEVNLARGPGVKKIDPKYIGPFRVLKVYTSSLVVIPWTENSRLEEYYKDPNAFRLMHRGDIRPFYTRMVSTKYCKPFRGKMEIQHIIDPIMMKEFLDTLGVDSNDEILSEHDPRANSGYHSDESGDESSDSPRPPPQGGNQGGQVPPANQNMDDSDLSDWVDEPPPAPVVEQAQPVQRAPSINLEQAHALARKANKKRKHRSTGSTVTNSAIDRLVENLNLSPRRKLILRKQLELIELKNPAKMHRRKIDELEQLIRSPDAGVRRRAEHELREALDQLKVDQKGLRNTTGLDVGDDSQTSNDEESDDESQDSESSDSHATDVEEQSDEHSMEWEHEAEIETPPRVRTPPTPARRRQRSPEAGGSRGPKYTSTPVTTQVGRPKGGQKHKEVQDWLVDTRHKHGVVPTPEIRTRSGRISKPPVRFGYEDPQVARDLQEKKDLERTLELSRRDWEQERRRLRDSTTPGRRATDDLLRELERSHEARMEYNERQRSLDNIASPDRAGLDDLLRDLNRSHRARDIWDQKRAEAASQILPREESLSERLDRSHQAYLRNQESLRFQDSETRHDLSGLESSSPTSAAARSRRVPTETSPTGAVSKKSTLKSKSSKKE